MKVPPMTPELPTVAIEELRRLCERRAEWDRTDVHEVGELIPSLLSALEDSRRMLEAWKRWADTAELLDVPASSHWLMRPDKKAPAPQEPDRDE